MLNHNEVIEKLTIKQKISLLTDIRSLSNPAINEAGVPCVSIMSLEKLLSDAFEGLSSSRLANSWDADLIESVTCEAIARAETEGAKFLTTPAAKPKLNVYQTALSEDPFLSGAMSAAYVSGVRKAGAECMLDGFYITSTDIEQLDVAPDMYALGEMLIKPYIVSSKDNGYKGVISTDVALPGRYKNINEKLMTSNSAVNMFNGKVRLCAPRDDNATLAAILDGKIVLHGGAAALESAYEKYRYMLDAIKKEIVSAEDLDDALQDGSAVSDEMVDRAVSRVLDFAHEISDNAANASINEKNIKKEALSAACVLLKNQKEILPLKAQNRVAVIGNIAGAEDFAETVCKKAGVQLIGKANGYEQDALIRGGDIEKAKELAKAADRVIVLLGVTKEQGRRALGQRMLSLPANQVELLHELREYREKTVGIVDCDYAVDMSFSSYLSAVLLASVCGVDAAEALADILVGRECPSGKLASTLYENTADHFARLRQCKNLGKNKVGQFLGYRHYDTSELDIEFPFGHGLSYTCFEYSNLRANAKEVSFLVKNTGKMGGAEIAQVYIGKPESSRIRAKKQLCGFVKVFLKPGELKEVRVDVSGFSFYNAEVDRWICESGKYNVYVGASAKDIRLNGSFTVKGEACAACKEQKSDYLQAYTNIIKDEYLVEPRVARPKKRWRLKLIAALLSVAAVVAVIAAGLNEITCILGGALILTGVVLLIVDGRRKKKIIQKQEAEARMGKDKYLEAAEQKEFDSIEELFVEEFDAVNTSQEADEQDQAYVDDTARYIDLNYKLPAAAADLEAFMRDRGISLSSLETMQFISAMAASRLVIADISGADRDKFYGTLAEYFGCPACIETFREEYVGTHLMFRVDENGLYEKTDLVKLIESAKENKNTMHLAVFRGVSTHDLFDLFIPYLKYFSNPLRENRIIVKNPTANFVLPENMWFIAELAEGESITLAQSGIVKAAAVTQVRAQECEPSEQVNAHVGIGYYQFDHFIQQHKGRFYMSEELWKKVDALEAYTATYVPYRIGNKQWLQMEKYLAILTVAETDIFTALDRALCVNLLPEIMSLLKDKVKSGDKSLLEAIEQIFGEDKLPLCTKAVRNQGVSSASSTM